MEILPFDDDGHGSRIAELLGNNPYVAQGGVRWQGRDIILLWRDLSLWPTADQVLTNLLSSGKLDEDTENEEKNDSENKNDKQSKPQDQELKNKQKNVEMIK